MRGKIVVLAGAALLMATVSGADDTNANRLRAIGEGRALYLANCASCHGAYARGATAPDLTASGARDGSFSALHVVNHIAGRRDGFDNGTMPSWGRVYARRWPGGEGPALLQTWKLAKYLEFVQVPASPERVAAAPPRK
jgi:mono/diheme cytochrome c family protein